MTVEKKIGPCVVRVVRDDLTNLDVDAFVFYAQPSLALGSGTGNAITQRGGPRIQEELSKLGPIKTTEVVVTGGGELNAKSIIHAVGPRFQEEGTDKKLEATMEHVMDAAQAKGIQTLALPPMGTGFYGVPVPLSAAVTLGVLKKHLDEKSPLRQVIICCTDQREIGPYSKTLESL